MSTGTREDSNFWKKSESEMVHDMRAELDLVRSINALPHYQAVKVDKCTL